MNKTIAISITTHNRYDVFLETYKAVKKYLPKEAKIFVVDDGSEIPVKEADFRFETTQGIAAAKNKCFELAEGFDYHFAFDDDTYPKVKDWHLPYIESGLNHLCFSFDHFSNGKPNGRKIVGKTGNIVRYHEPCGCMNFYTKECFDKVGGMDVAFGAWSYEHVSHSMRIHNAGLTPYPFMDIENSLDLFTSLDYEQTVTRSVDALVRAKLANVNRVKYLKEIKSSAYIPYKEQKGVVLTTYLTGSVDPQRGEKWTADIEQCRVLAESVKRNGTELVLINDCFSKVDTDKIGISNVNRDYEYITENPYFNRWFAYRQYLKDNKHDNVFLTDCNDVELLRHPFRNIQPGKLYVGWEKEVIGCQWMLNHHKSNFGQIFIKCNMKTPLLNAGVIGGRYEIVMEFLDRICDMIGILPDFELDSTDMMLFNWVLYSHFNGRFETGASVTTIFKAYDYSNKQAIWRHK